ncbi:MAG: dihydroorotate dehydrogenase (quinone) [Candidatus Komeilibacteria bacterium RIFOXYC1_FULL_37_11]|uniref:Dihydroorotate dehydrogenase (quinone) n=1 Tax=Candidatus Komeilibacteria bacterium RIFOXYC1_FULL_37_11 TaxID=1798555 RepID=A0A1G2C0A8_9BACT|nr:MAG: dihydroorotate dehydrogenase (quinone) [Candidatus Komeilibacteria bacterium RIFOXYC1_FULL_37_11]OGY95511.1 MAG: dihydroorotate dehydrogenase (quinone) [Candidatus Komeilibacteria bacterium RIFOXYD1_FULL_37_29]
MFYQRVIRPILFLIDPEKIHNFTIWGLSFFSKYKLLNVLLKAKLNYTSPRLRQRLCGLNFKNPIGLAAGLDKNGQAINTWSAMGFAWAEIGSITYQAQSGNKKPRLWRLPQDKGLVVYYGLYNQGAHKIVEQLKKKTGLISASIAKSNDIALEQAADDYQATFEVVSPYADIITINLSCPNVDNFTGLQSKKLLEPILERVQSINKQQKPIWLKIGQDLSKAELDDIIYLSKKYHIDAIIACNLAKDRGSLDLKSLHRDKPGGISGEKIRDRVDKIIAYLYQNSEGQYKIIGTGGIFSGYDAYKKIKAGANLVQLITGLIYNGPMTINIINRQLENLLANDNFKHISEAVGLESGDYHLYE